MVNGVDELDMFMWFVNGGMYFEPDPREVASQLPIDNPSTPTFAATRSSPAFGSARSPTRLTRGSTVARAYHKPKHRSRPDASSRGSSSTWLRASPPSHQDGCGSAPTWLV